MLRIVALVLLLANALLLAAHWGALDGLTPGAGAASQREPERLQRQVNPGAVQILSPSAASAALSAAAASAAQTAAAASSAAATACLEAGPLGPGDTDAAERRLRDAGLAAGSWLAQITEDRGAFLLYMGRYAERETLLAKQEQLKRLKVDAEELRNTPAWQPGLDLGRFDNKPGADEALASLVQRGVRTARVVTLRPAQRLTLLRLPAADVALRARLAGVRLGGGAGFVACTAPAGPAAARVAPGASAGPAAPVASTATGPRPASTAAAAPSSAPRSASRSASR